MAKKKLTTVEQVAAAKAAGTYPVNKKSNTKKNSVSLTGPEAERRRAAGRQALWERQRKKPYDAQFTPEYFTGSDYYETLVDIPYEEMTTRQKGEHIDMFWRWQAGTNYMRENGMDKSYEASDDIFELNNDINLNISERYLKDFLSEAGEDDVRWLIGDLQAKYNDAARSGESNYKRYLEEGLSTIRDYARNNFSSFVGEDIARINEDMAKLDAQIKSNSQS